MIYHLPLDWRRAKFCVDHPTTLPGDDNLAVTMSDEPACFVAIDRITDVLLLRDWLHTAARQGRYDMFGCYEQVTNYFRGIIFVFDIVADMRRFRRYLESATVTHCRSGSVA